MTYTDKQKEIAYQRKYYKENREKRKAYQREYAKKKKAEEADAALKAEAQKEAKRRCQAKRRVVWKNQNKARMQAMEQAERVYTHSDLMQMPAEKLAKIIGRSDFEIAGVR